LWPVWERFFYIIFSKKESDFSRIFFFDHFSDLSLPGCHFVQKDRCFPPNNTAGGADLGTGRGQTLFNPVQAEIAFNGRFFFLIKLHGPERTGRHTFPAADTVFPFDEHQAPVVSIYGLHRADIPAGRLGAMATIDRDKERAFFIDPDQAGADPELMLLLAGHFTGMTAAAIFFINGQGFLFHIPAS
jgi:hypothetical protein